MKKRVPPDNVASQTRPQISMGYFTHVAARRRLGHGSHCHSEAVLQYFELCRKFWSMGGERLDEWIKNVKAGLAPDFGANLVY